MTPEEIVEKLTECIVISDNVSVWNPEHDTENPGPMTGLNMIDNLIVDILKELNPDWERPN